MAWHRTGDKPLSESMIVYWHIYASLGLNELRILPSVQQHAYWIPRVTACLYQLVSEYHLLCRTQHFVKDFINYQMLWYLPFFRNMQIVFTFHKRLDIEFMSPMCVVSNYDIFTIHIFWKFDFLSVDKQYKPESCMVMMTSSNGNIFRVTGPLCGEFTGPGEFPTQRPVTRSFDVFFDLRLNKRLNKQPWGWWFETLSWPLWRHCNGIKHLLSQPHLYWTLSLNVDHKQCFLSPVVNSETTEFSSQWGTKEVENERILPLWEPKQLWSA